MVFYTLCISVFNLALGYALALFLQSRGASPDWLRPEFLARLPLRRFGLGRRNSVAEATTVASASHLIASASSIPADHSPAESIEFGVDAAMKDDSLEPMLTRGE